MLKLFSDKIAIVKHSIEDELANIMKANLMVLSPLHISPKYDSWGEQVTCFSPINQITSP